MAEQGGEGGGGVLRELLAVFGFKVDHEELEKGENRLKEFLEKVKEVGEGLLAAFAVEKLFEFAEAQVHAMTAVEHLAAQIGISTDAVQAWQFAAQSAGFESEKFLRAMSRLQVAAGSGKGAKTFKELGVSIKDASGKSKDASELFTDVAEAVRKTEDPNKRAALATRLFGRSGRELLPFLEEGRAGVEELMEAYKELGGAFTEKRIAQGKEFERENAKLNLTFKSLKATIAETVIPIFTRLMKIATPIIHWFTELVNKSNVVKAALIVLGGIIAATVLPPLIAMAAAIAAPAAGLLLLIGLVDDLITFLTGGKSVIGDVLDKIWGKGTSVEVVKKLKEYWGDVVEVFKTLWGWVSKVWDFYKWLLEKAGAIGGALGDTVGKVVGSIRSGSVREDVGNVLSRAAGLEPPVASVSPAVANPFGNYQPSAAGFELAGPGAAGAVTIHQTINPAPGMDEKKLGKHAAEHVEKAIRHRHQAAAATLERAPSGS